MDNQEKNNSKSRRDFIKKMAYMPPAIATLTVFPAFHASGSGLTRTRGNNGLGNGLDGQPPGNPPINDGPGTGPGNPGNRGRFRGRT